jgi:hypothetical protein
MDLFGSGCPVEDRERDWIQDNVAWLRGEFGDGPLSAPVILPTSEWFPPPFAARPEPTPEPALSRSSRWTGR